MGQTKGEVKKWADDGLATVCLEEIKVIVD
jgi:hypothetical protein